MNPDQIRILHSLAQQKKTRDMAALTDHQRKVHLGEKTITNLTDKVSAISENILAGDLATTARWLGWAGQEKSHLLKSQQSLEQAAEIIRQTAAKSDAKTRVINDLLTKAEALEILDNRRRAERMGREPDK